MRDPRKNMNWRQYEHQYQANKKAAVREILQENIKAATVVTNERLTGNFKEGAKGR